MKYENLAFIDFGAGAGKSFSFASAFAPGNGLAIDVQESAVAACREKDIPAEVGDLLTFEGRSVSQATFAINVLQELPGRAAFRQAMINLLRAASSFSVIQHNYFDADADLARNGLFLKGNWDKKTLFKPTVADYVDFLNTYKAALNISGMAIFAAGAVAPEAYEIGSGPGGAEGMKPLPRTLRVLFGRKNVNRFRPAVVRTQYGNRIFMWEDMSQDVDGEA